MFTIVLLMPQRWLDNWILNLVVKQIFITRAMIDNDAKIFLQIDGVHYGQAVFFYPTTTKQVMQ